MKELYREGVADHPDLEEWLGSPTFLLLPLKYMPCSSTPGRHQLQPFSESLVLLSALLTASANPTLNFSRLNRSLSLTACTLLVYA